MTADGLLGRSRVEQVEYLRRVFAAQPAAVERAGRVVDLPELYRNLVILEVAELAPAQLARALETVAQVGCLACEHERHRPGDCLVALVGADGGSYCTCGSEVGR